MLSNEKLRDWVERSFFQVKPRQFEYSPCFSNTQKLLIVVPYFNPLGDLQREKSFLRFKQKLKQNLSNSRVLIVETLLGENSKKAEWNLEESSFHHLKTYSSAILWQKERLLNLALDYAVAEGFEFMTWLDADLEMEDPYWEARLCKNLESNEFLQCFDAAYLEENHKGTKYRIKRSAASHFGAKQSLANKGIASGLAWAARVSCLKKCRFFDAAIVGGGDTAFYYALLKTQVPADDWHLALSNVSFFQKMPPKLLVDFKKWTANKEQESIKIGALEQNLKAYYHGEQYLRQKRSRYNALQDFDPSTELEITASGAWTWSKQANPRHIQVVEEFFKLRASSERQKSFSQTS